MRLGSRPLVTTACTLLLAAAFACALLVAPRHATTAPPPSTVLKLAPEAGLAYDVRNADNGERIPCKLTLIGINGTARPLLTRNDIGRQEGDSIVAYDRIMSATGLGVARVPFGVYDVYVSRGPEWDLYVAHKVVVGAKGAFVAARLRHVVDSAGWISADFYVHAAASTDSHVPMQDRIYEFLSDGVEFITSTDHNVVADYAPIIAELGVAKEIGSIVGDEMTTGSWGHFGAFPLPQDLERAGQGAVLVHGRTAVDVFADVRKLAPGAIIDVHHPRIDKDIGYFNLGKFDSATDHADRAGFSHDFDAVEVLNGYQDPERRHIDRVIQDWFNLLNHGRVATATGNSDTHHLDMNIGGYPRNYVRVNDDAPPRVTPAEIAAGVRGHHSFFTTAPFVRFRVDKADIGDVARASSGKVTAEVEVQAAPWVSVSTVTLYQSGREVKKWQVPAGQERLRFKGSAELSVERDGWVVARVDGDQPLAPVVGDRIRFDVRPLAVTNPIFLDHDGNGVYDAPLARKAVK